MQARVDSTAEAEPWLTIRTLPVRRAFTVLDLSQAQERRGSQPESGSIRLHNPYDGAPLTLVARCGKSRWLFVTDVTVLDCSRDDPNFTLYVLYAVQPDRLSRA